MREIKFRAWYDIDRTMIKPMSIQKMIHQKKNTIPLKKINENCYFMQYTGLKDKNGTEIYEDDILYDSDNDEYSKVVYEEGKYSIECEAVWLDLFENADYLEVAGNIYENSELLEVIK